MFAFESYKNESGLMVSEMVRGEEALELVKEHCYATPRELHFFYDEQTAIEERAELVKKAFTYPSDAVEGD